MEEEPTEVVALTVAAVQSLIGGLTSRWNGLVTLSEVTNHAGIMRPDGEIVLLQSIWEKGGAPRYRTIIHETLHSFSQWTTPQYRDGKGREEGVVENLQRLLRQQILGTIGVAIPESDFAVGDNTHPFNPYILELEKLRSLLAIYDAAFYIELLKTPLPSRFDLC